MAKVTLIIKNHMREVARSTYDHEPDVLMSPGASDAIIKACREHPELLQPGASVTVVALADDSDA